MLSFREPLLTTGIGQKVKVTLTIWLLGQKVKVAVAIWFQEFASVAIPLRNIIVDITSVQMIVGPQDTM